MRMRGTGDGNWMTFIWRTGCSRAAAAAVAALAVLGAALVATGRGSESAGAATVDPADLSVIKSDSPDPVTTGAALVYTVRVTNAGPDPATNTTVTDGLPGGVTFVSATTSAGDCDRSGSKVTCDLGTVDASVTRTVTIRTTVKKKSGEMTNSASVASDVTDPNPANNLDTELTRISNPKPIECAGQPVTIFGTPGPDTVVGTVGDDVILADDGDDLVFAFRGADLICAGSGSDVVRAGGGNDAVLGRRGSDRIWGRRGEDLLRGGLGHDRIRGQGGDDLVVGGRGFDRCRGGRGLDTLRSCER
jgi:uncharacterized repeat protein (TIGR01451 family)